MTLRATPGPWQARATTRPVSYDSGRTADGPTTAVDDGPTTAVDDATTGIPT